MVTRCGGTTDEPSGRNSVRAAYIHKAEHLRACKAMMPWWSDYLDSCRSAYIPPWQYAKNAGMNAALLAHTITVRYQALSTNRDVRFRSKKNAIYLLPH